MTVIYVLWDTYDDDYVRGVYRDLATAVETAVHFSNAEEAFSTKVDIEASDITETKCSDNSPLYGYGKNVVMCALLHVPDIVHNVLHELSFKSETFRLEIFERKDYNGKTALYLAIANRSKCLEQMLQMLQQLPKQRVCKIWKSMPSNVTRYKHADMFELAKEFYPESLEMLQQFYDNYIV